MSTRKPGAGRGTPSGAARGKAAAAALRCRRRFLRFFPGGFRDETYLAWEREYKWETHERWEEALSREEFRRLLRRREFSEVAARAARVEQRSRYSMIFSFEKMALRDGLKSSDEKRRRFMHCLNDLLYGTSNEEARFSSWSETVALDCCWVPAV